MQLVEKTKLLFRDRLYATFSELFLPSVLWRCWLGGRKVIWPVKNLSGGGAGMVICLERGADLHMAQLMPLPLTVSCLSNIQIGFTFLVPADLGSPGKRAVKRVCVCVCACVRACVRVHMCVCVSVSNFCTLCIFWWISYSVLFIYQPVLFDEIF